MNRLINNNLFIINKPLKILKNQLLYTTTTTIVHKANHHHHQQPISTLLENLKLTKNIKCCFIGGIHNNSTTNNNQFLGNGRFVLSGGGSGFTTIKNNPNHRNYTLKSTGGVDNNTNDKNLTKDIIVYHYENPRFFKVLNIFGFCQFFFWIYLANFSYTQLRDAPVDKSDNSHVDKSWYERINLGENKYRNGIATFCLLLGWGILAIACTYTLRSVRYLILRKNGNDVCFVTYTPLGSNRLMNVPLKNISAQESREAARTTLPIKVKNRSFYYILDMRGDFRNTRLYDYSIGLKRKL